MRVKSLPSKERLNELLSFDPTTGEFRWKVSTNRRIKVGDVAGYNDGGRLLIRIDCILYKAHRLAYYLMTGQQPVEIDHCNGNPLDNRFANLRAASHKLNMYNLPKQKNNKTGVIGVSWNKGAKQWLVTFGSVEFRKKNKTHKYFHDFFEALCQRKAWENQYGMTELKKHR